MSQYYGKDDDHEDVKNDDYARRKKRGWKRHAVNDKEQQHNQRSRQGFDPSGYDDNKDVRGDADDLPYEYVQRRGKGWNEFYDEQYDYDANYARRGEYVGKEQDTKNSGYKRGRYAGKGPKDWQRSDEVVRDKVSEALSRHDDIDPSDVSITVKDGEVILEGTIKDRWMKRHMEDVVYSIVGVKDVMNQVRLQIDNNDDNEKTVVNQHNRTQKRSDWIAGGVSEDNDS